MIGYILYAALVLSIVLGLYTLTRLFRGQGAGIWGKATGAALIVMAVAFVLWATVEAPAYERQQAQLHLQAGLEYLQAGDDVNALQSFLKISKYNQEIYAGVQPKIAELRYHLATTQLEQAKSLYAGGQYQAAWQALQQSQEYMLLDEYQQLLPVYRAAAGQ